MVILFIFVSCLLFISFFLAVYFCLLFSISRFSAAFVILLMFIIFISLRHFISFLHFICFSVTLFAIIIDLLFLRRYFFVRYFSYMSFSHIYYFFSAFSLASYRFHMLSLLAIIYFRCLFFEHILIYLFAIMLSIEIFDFSVYLLFTFIFFFRYERYHDYLMIICRFTFTWRLFELFWCRHAFDFRRYAVFSLFSPSTTPLITTILLSFFAIRDMMLLRFRWYAAAVALLRCLHYFSLFFFSCCIFRYFFRCFAIVAAIIPRYWYCRCFFSCFFTII